MLTLRRTPACTKCHRELEAEVVERITGRITVILRCPRHGIARNYLLGFYAETSPRIFIDLGARNGSSERGDPSTDPSPG